MAELITFEKLAAIWPSNELYFLATQEKLMRALKEVPYRRFPIIRLRSRKVQQDGKESSVDWRGEEKILPWESANYVDILKYGINYDCNDPRHGSWGLQETAKRCRLRGIKAVFIDELRLRFRLTKDPKYAFWEATFECTPIPGRSTDTLKEIQGLIRDFSEKYKLYPEIGKRDRRFYRRIYEHPSCLDLVRIEYTGDSRIFKPNDITEGILKTTNPKTQRFFWLLSKATGYQVLITRKKFDQVQGFIFDGIVSPRRIEEMLRREGY
jgi:hypothetical protein